jgi:putative oxidoreductase
MHIALWVVQALLSLAFAAAGVTKLITPIAELATKGMGGWVLDSPEALIRFIGASEVLAAIGLIAPAATRIAPKLTPAAAIGLVVVMVLAAATHLAYGEFTGVAPNIVLAGLAGFVAWGRLKRHPIAPRG